MKLSRFTVSVPNYPTAKETLLFNTLTQSLVLVEEGLQKVLDRLPLTEDIDQKTSEYLKALEECGTVVGDEVDEDKVLRHWFDQLKYDTSTLEVVVLTTYACNFRCSYCVEEGVKGKIYMTPEVCRQTVEWLEGRLEEMNPKRLRVNFYGGEPLLNTPAIKTISRHLSTITENRGIVFESSIITNGALLKRELVKELVGYGLKGVKVTLDGDREAHNRKRPFRGGRGSFDIILRNICEVADTVKVNIGGNFDQENIESIPRLLDYLKGQHLEENLGIVEFKPIMGRLDDLRTPGGQNRLCQSFSEGGLAEEYLWLKKETVKKGFNTPTGLGISLCNLTGNNYSAVIDPEGKIYKCPALVGYDEFVVGDISQDELNYRHTEFMTMDVWEKCQDCPYVPICAGGCRFLAYLQTGRFDQIACEKRFFEQVGAELLKLDYEKESE